LHLLPVKVGVLLAMKRGFLFLAFLLLLGFLAPLLALLLMSVQCLKHVLLHEDALHSEVQILAGLNIVHVPVILYGLGIEGRELLQGLVRGLLSVPVDENL